MTGVTDFGGTSLCRTETLIESGFPYAKSKAPEVFNFRGFFIRALNDLASAWPDFAKCRSARISQPGFVRAGDICLALNCSMQADL